jgi:cytochrome c-type biogenesis protein CcmH
MPDPTTIPRTVRAALLAAIAGVVSAGIVLVSPAVALEPSERLADPALESRARGLSAQLRCLVCQNQSIDDSNAPLAKDLRLLVRERLQQGESDTQVMDYVVARYGDFVLLKPPFKVSTLMLWIAPPLGLLAIGYALLRTSGFLGATPATAGAGATAAPLSAEEEARLRSLVDDGDGRRLGRE